ncbi:hypothetical protein CTA2_936 [Colletotrichum tanaceti]|nr:hypothetical protein CTA2_936 [Colletotrichum tanaceti]
MGFLSCYGREFGGVKSLHRLSFGGPKNDGATRRAHGRITGIFSCLYGAMECLP